MELPTPGPEAGPSDANPAAEPRTGPRVRRPLDRLRFLLGLLGLALVLGIAWGAQSTTSGVEQDVSHGSAHASGLLIDLVGFVASCAVLVVPAAFAVERLVRRDGLRVAGGVLSAVLANGCAQLADLWVTGSGSAAIREALTQSAPGGGSTAAVHGYLAPVVAYLTYMTATGTGRRPAWRGAAWAAVLLEAFALLIGGYGTLFSLLVTLLTGATVACGTAYLIGSPRALAGDSALFAGLRRVGFEPVAAQPLDPADDGRRYLVTVASGPPLDVTVIDREQQGRGFFHRTWRRLQLRDITERRSLVSLREALAQEALLAYAATAAGARVPALLAASGIDRDAAVLVYEHVDGRTLDQLGDDEITDELLDSTWQQVRTLQTRRIAHRRLTGDVLRVDGLGRIHLTDLYGGEIAAGDLLLRLDVAQLLTTLALRVGPVRSVAAAVRTLGPDAVADSLPLLQPVALSGPTRAALRRLAKERAQQQREVGPEGAQDDDLLGGIREQILRIRPQAPVAPARLERLRPRTLIALVAGCFAGYYLLSQLADVDLGALVREAHLSWALAALGFSALTYAAAAMSLLGFVPEDVPFWRTVQAQLGASFLVTPAAVGGIALNTRYLQRQGVRPGLAVASVGAAQLATGVGHVLLLLGFGYLTGAQDGVMVSDSRSVLVVVLAAGALVGVIAAVPRLRHLVLSRVRPLFAGVLPRMLDLTQRPSKLLTGVGGVLLLNLAFIACLDASIRAFGHSLSFPAVAVVYLVGTAVGSATPTPGGVGGIETVLSTALTLAGLPSQVAFSSVLLYRLATFWLPVLPGWAAFTHLSRKQLI